MSLWKIAWRSIQQRPLASALTAFSMALGVALVITVLVVYGVIYRSFHRGGEGYDLIVGAKGSKEQLVLNTVYYLSQPIANIPYSYYEEFTEGRFRKDVDVAIPLCMGHTFQGFRVVGTVPEMFEELKYFGGEQYKFEPGGENFKADDPCGAVIGATVARETALQVGSTFQAVHGVAEEGGKTHKQSFNVVGILAPTGTPNDRALFVNMEGFYQIHTQEQGRQEKAAPTASAAADGEKPASGDEDHDAPDHDPHQHKQVTAILVRLLAMPSTRTDEITREERLAEKPRLREKEQELASPARVETVAHAINEGPVAQAVKPGRVITELFEGVIGKIQGILLVMAVLIVVVAGIGIMVSIYNSMNDRRREIAIMRALGARRTTVMLVILLESILLSLGGGVLGLLLGHGVIFLLSSKIVDWTGIYIGLFHFHPSELILIPGLVLLATVVGYLPALTAYRTDVARSLAASP